MSRILVVDDSDAVSLLLTHVLTENGHEVTVAADAQQAVQAILKQTPDLILLDVMLPDVGGLQLCALLRKQSATKNVPIIMITGTAISPKEKALGLQSGADDYLAKPFEPEELIERIRAVLRRTTAMPMRANVDAPAPASRPSDPAAMIHPLNGDRHAGHALGRGLATVITAPRNLGEDLPPVSLLFLVSLLILSGLSVVVTSDLPARPFVIAIVSVLLWSVLTAVLVVTCSLFGIVISWKQGSRLISLASVPILLKLAGGMVLASVTSLSPFLFTAGPALFVHPASFWLYRLDVFEIWSALLVGVLLKSRPRASMIKTVCVTLIVAISAIFFLFCVVQLHSKV